MLKHYRLLLSLSALPLALAAQNKIYVDATASGAQDGTSWEGAYGRLDNALSAAAATDTILLREGIYLAPQAGFGFTTGALLIGGFAGDEAYATQSNPLAHPTILSGDAAGDDPNDLASANFVQDARLRDNAPLILRVTADGGDKRIEGLGIEASHTPLGTGRGDVAGIVVRHTIAGPGSPTRSEVTFHKCRIRRHSHRVGSVFEMGGDYDPGDVGLVRFDRCTVTDNYALAALFAIDDASVDGAQEHLVVTNTEIVGNRFVVSGRENARVANGDVFALFWSASANRRTDKRLAILNSTIADNGHLPDEETVAGNRGIINADYLNDVPGARDTTAIQIAIVNSVFDDFHTPALVFNPRGFDIGRSYFLGNNLSGPLIAGISPSTDFVDTVTVAGETVAEQLARTSAFLDASRGRYGLLPCGDGVDVGLPELSILAGTDFDYLRAMANAATDLTGRPRVSGSAQDRGAYEGPYDDGLLTLVAGTPNTLQLTPPLPGGQVRYSLVDCATSGVIAGPSEAFRFAPPNDGDYRARIIYTGGDHTTGCSWETPCVAYQSGTSSLAEADRAEVRVAPNPAGDYLRVDAPAAVRGVRIYDSAGRLLSEQAATGGLVRTDDLRSGLYLLSVELADGRRAVERFVRE